MSCLESVAFLWHWCVHRGSCKATLYTPHSTLHTLHFTLKTLNSTLHTPHFTLHTSHSTLYTPHSTLYTPHFTLHTPHSTLYTPHSTLYTPHSTLYTLHSTLYTPHSTLYTWHFTLHSLHFTLYVSSTYVWAFGFVGFILFFLVFLKLSGAKVMHLMTQRYHNNLLDFLKWFHLYKKSHCKVTKHVFSCAKNRTANAGRVATIFPGYPRHLGETQIFRNHEQPGSKACVHMYVCMYVCMCVCIYIYVYIYI